MLWCVYHPSLVAQTSTEAGENYQDHVRLPGIFCDEPGHGQDWFIPSLIRKNIKGTQLHCAKTTQYVIGRKTKQKKKIATK